METLIHNEIHFFFSLDIFFFFLFFLRYHFSGVLFLFCRLFRSTFVVSAGRLTHLFCIIFFSPLSRLQVGVSQLLFNYFTPRDSVFAYLLLLVRMGGGWVVNGVDLFSFFFLLFLYHVFFLYQNPL